MSTDFCWWFFGVPRAEHAALQPAFAAAIAEPLPPGVEEAVHGWRSEPRYVETAADEIDRFYARLRDSREVAHRADLLRKLNAACAGGEADPVSIEEAVLWQKQYSQFIDRAWARYVDFQRAFFLPGVISLLGRLVHFRLGLSPNGLLKAVVVNRTPPAAILWQGLGPERAGRLPGTLGNLLIAVDEVRAVLVEVRSVLDVPEEGVVTRAAALRRDYFECADVVKTLEALPCALEEARRERVGLLALCGTCDLSDEGDDSDTRNQLGAE